MPTSYRYPASTPSLLIRVGGVVIAASALASCSVGASAPPPTTAVTVPAPVIEAAIAAGECIDSTASVPSPVVTAAIEASAHAVETWVPDPTDRAKGSPPVPGLDLSVRKVLSGSSLDPRGQVARVHVPSIPSVIPKTALTNPDASTHNRHHRDQASQADAVSDNARTEAVAGAAAIRQADWSAGSSEIAGCLEALALTVAPGRERRLIVVSDLDQTDVPQVGLARFEQARILIVHACAEATRCRDQQPAWSDALYQRGAAEVKFGRPENMSTDIASWLRSGVAT